MREAVRGHDGEVRSLWAEELLRTSDTITLRDLVALDGEMLRYFLRVYLDPETDARTRWLAATRLADISKEARAAWTATEGELRFDRIEARQDAMQQCQRAFSVTVEHMLDICDSLMRRLKDPEENGEEER